MTKYIISNHSRYLNIAFGGVVLGELIGFAHEYGVFGKGLLWKVGTAIPENLGTLISFVCGAILWMYLQQAWANRKVFKTVSISTLIAMEGLFCLCSIFGIDNESLSDDASLWMFLLVGMPYCAISLYVAVVLIVKSDSYFRLAGFVTIVSALVGLAAVFSDEAENPVLSFVESLMTLLSCFFIKEGCLNELDDDEVEIGTLQYAQMAYALFIPFLLICCVIF